MGFDMYGWSTKGQGHYPDVLEADNDITFSESFNEIMYWRKHPNLHGWMKALYEKKGGKGDFNCAYVRLTSEDIDRLEKDVLSDSLPSTTGFFFGESSFADKDRDIEFIKLAREALEYGASVYYSSWW